MAAYILQFSVLFLCLLVIGLLLALFKKITPFDARSMEEKRDLMVRDLERMDRNLREEIVKNRDEFAVQARRAREELAGSLALSFDSFMARMGEISTLQKDQLQLFSSQITALTRMNEEKMDRLRAEVDGRLKSLQEENVRKLDQMRDVVEEKLHKTLETRLGESFRLVSERLELVHRGLGEMQNLATSVGDLKKVLTNVKARGTWGEIQLGNLLDQVLSTEQYARNVATRRGSNDRVEFAIRLPGQNDHGGVLWLPIDAKFPQEDYQRLVDAQDRASVAEAEEASRHLENRIKVEARAIRDKYIDPPHTTDFAIMFLPVEGLYAEIVRRPGLCDLLQRECRVVVAGPTTFAALLNSLSMGFRSLAIEKRSSEVWALLGVVKTEFGRFGDLLEKTHRKLEEASNTIESATRKSRTIEKKLKKVQELPSCEAAGIVASEEEEEDEKTGR